MPAQKPTFALNANTTIPAVGFGTYLISKDDAETAVCTATEAGYRHIDTASGYKNEVTVGAGIKKGLQGAGIGREDLFVTAKLWPGNPAWGDAPKTGAQTIAECDASLDRLGLDYVDLYLIHAPYGGDMRLEQWGALLEIQKSGKPAQLASVISTNSIWTRSRSLGCPCPTPTKSSCIHGHRNRT